jgi:hypothetical protein
LLGDLLLKEVLVGQLDMGLRVDKVQTLEAALVVEEQERREQIKQEQPQAQQEEAAGQITFLDLLFYMQQAEVEDLTLLVFRQAQLLEIQVVVMVEMHQQTMLKQLEFPLAEEEELLLHPIEVVEEVEEVDIMLGACQLETEATEVAELWLSAI